MAQKEFKAKFTADNSDFNKKADQLAQTGKSLTNKFKAFGAAIAAVFALDKIVSFGKEALGLAAKAEGIKAAFDRLNNPTLLNDLRRATRGTVDDLTLMQKAVQAKNFKIPLDQLATYFEFATKRAIQTGESVDYLVDSIITGIGRKSVLVMDNLGISAVALQDEVKKTGDFATAAGNIINKELTEMGNVADTTTIKIAKLNTSWTNFKTKVGESIIQTKAFGAVMQWIQDEAEIFGDKNLSFWEKINGSPEDYKKWKKQQETLRTEWKKTLSVYADDELQARKGIMTDKEANKQIDLEIAARAELKKQLEENLRILKELNTHKSTGVTNVETPKSTKIAKVATPFVESKSSKLSLLRDTSFDKNPETLADSLSAHIRSIDEYNDSVVAAAEAAQQLVLQEQLLKEAAAEDTFQAQMDLVGQLEGAFVSMFTSISSGSGGAFAAMAESFKRAILQMAAVMAAKAALFGILTLLTGGTGGLAGFATKAVSGGLRKNVLGFADGGGVSGPTMAMVGEAPGISRSNPEYIGTASQLSQMGIGSGGSLTCRVSRGDLLFMLNEGQSANNNNF